MEDLLYFVQKNPWLVFIVIFMIFRKVFGGGEKAKKQKEEQAARRAAAREKNRAKTEQVGGARQSRGGGLSGEGILAQIQRQIEEATQQAENTARGQIGSSEVTSMSRPQELMSGPSDAENTAKMDAIIQKNADARAAREMARTSDLFDEPTAVMARPVEDVPTDYDRNNRSFEYRSESNRKVSLVPDDVTWHMKKQVSTLDSFAFNPADSQPADVSYHMKQRGYASATRIDAPKVSVPEEQGRPAPVAVGELFASSDALTRAFILQEILGTPRGMRRPGPNRMRPR